MAILPVRLRVAVQMACLLGVLAISVYVIKLSATLTLQSWGREIEVLHLPYFYIYGVVPICFVLIAYHSCAQIIDLARNGIHAMTLQGRLLSDVEV